MLSGDDVHDDGGGGGCRSRSRLRPAKRSSIRWGCDDDDDDDAANDSCGAEAGCSAEERERWYFRAFSQRAITQERRLRQSWVAISGTELAVAAAAGFAIVGVGDEMEVPVMKVVAGPFELSEGEAASPERCRQKSSL